MSESNRKLITPLRLGLVAIVFAGAVFLSVRFQYGWCLDDAEQTQEQYQAAYTAAQAKCERDYQKRIAADQSFVIQQSNGAAEEKRRYCKEKASEQYFDPLASPDLCAQRYMGYGTIWIFFLTGAGLVLLSLTLYESDQTSKHAAEMLRLEKGQRRPWIKATPIISSNILIDADAGVVIGPNIDVKLENIGNRPATRWHVICRAMPMKDIGQKNEVGSIASEFLESYEKGILKHISTHAIFPNEVYIDKETCHGILKSDMDRVFQEVSTNEFPSFEILIFGTVVYWSTDRQNVGRSDFYGWVGIKENGTANPQPVSIKNSRIIKRDDIVMIQKLTAFDFVVK